MLALNGPVLFQLINGLTMTRGSTRQHPGICDTEVHPDFVYNQRRIL